MKNMIITLFILLYASFTFGWGSNTHNGMTKAAVHAIFGVDTTPVNFEFKISYDPDAYLATTVLMGFGGVYSPVAAFVGLVIDKAYTESKISVDTTWSYKNITADSMFTEAGQDPDDIDYPTALAGDGKLLLGHMYTPNGIGYADLMTKYYYDKAVNAYTKQKDKYLAFAYLGLASHYFEDVFIPVHVESDYLDVKNLMFQFNAHEPVESWISDNWYALFQAEAVEAAKYPMPVCDIPATVRSMALETYRDTAPWMKVWGVGKSPKDSLTFVKLVNQEIWRCVPRISGLYLKFIEETNYQP